MFNLQDPFYRPLWLRIGIVALCAAWAVFEVANGSPGWGLFFAAIGGWAGWQFFVVWTDPKRPGEEANGPAEDDAG